MGQAYMGFVGVVDQAHMSFVEQAELSKCVVAQFELLVSQYGEPKKRNRYTNVYYIHLFYIKDDLRLRFVIKRNFRDMEFFLSDDIMNNDIW